MSKCPTRKLYFLIGAGALVVFALFQWFRPHSRPYAAPPPPPPSHVGPVVPQHSESKTLAQAISKYTLKTSRKPPQGYAQWFSFAQENGCLIDEYDQVYKDFEPFYQAEERERGFFRKMVERAIEKVNAMSGDGKGLKTAQFRRGSFSYLNNHTTLYNYDWPRSMRRLAPLLPDMSIILNGRDEPRVLFNTREPDAISRALIPTDANPFGNTPKEGESTSVWYKDEKKCIIPMKNGGFTSLANGDSAFLINSASTDVTTDFYPLLSSTKVHPCFSIVIPSQFYYHEAKISSKYSSNGDAIPWDDRIPKLYWRGSSSGGQISNTNHPSFPRFHLITLGKSHPSLMDVRITQLVQCPSSTCDADAISEKYGIKEGQWASPEEVFKYKYVIDVDGNSFSGRYLGLMKSGGLVFKSTIFTEYFTPLLIPYVHYIPILPDLSDLVQKIEWARSHDEEARRIQEEGKRFVEKALGDDGNDCYLGMVLMEWGRLYNGEDWK